MVLFIGFVVWPQFKVIVFVVTAKKKIQVMYFAKKLSYVGSTLSITKISSLAEYFLSLELILVRIRQLILFIALISCCTEW